MTKDLTGNYFTASRGFYGTNSVKYKNIEIDVTKYNYDYTDSVTSFNWGDTTKASTLLAYAILSTISTPTIARIYANKYTLAVIQNIKEDEWQIEAIEVARWINKNSDYTIKIDEEKSSLTENIVTKCCSELGVKNETLAKILNVSIDTINNWKLENEMPKLALKAIEFYKAGIYFKEKNSKLQIEINQLQKELQKSNSKLKINSSDLNKYKKIINTLNISEVYKLFKEL